MNSNVRASSLYRVHCGYLHSIFRNWCSALQLSQRTIATRSTFFAETCGIWKRNPILALTSMMTRVRCKHWSLRSRMSQKKQPADDKVGLVLPIMWLLSPTKFDTVSLIPKGLVNGGLRLNLDFHPFIGQHKNINSRWRDSNIWPHLHNAIPSILTSSLLPLLTPINSSISFLKYILCYGHGRK